MYLKSSILTSIKESLEYYKKMQAKSNTNQNQITQKTDEALKWVNDNPAATKEEFDAKVKELEGVFNPIMMRVYQATGGQPGAGGMPNMNFNPEGQHQSTSQTNVDDVD